MCCDACNACSLRVASTHAMCACDEGIASYVMHPCVHVCMYGNVRVHPCMQSRVWLCAYDICMCNAWMCPMHAMHVCNSRMCVCMRVCNVMYVCMSLYVHVMHCTYVVYVL